MSTTESNVLYLPGHGRPCVANPRCPRKLTGNVVRFTGLSRTERRRRESNRALVARYRF